MLAAGVTYCASVNAFHLPNGRVCECQLRVKSVAERLSVAGEDRTI